MDGFKQYSDLQDLLFFHQGSATGIDTTTRTLTIKKPDQSEESLNYHALVIATGVRSPSPLTTLQGEHTLSIEALERANEALLAAQKIVIAGGGPIGVETAGEIVSHFPGKDITIITGDKRLLPSLAEGRASKALSMLQKKGIKVVFDVKVEGAEKGPDGKTVLKLSNGETVNDVDFYLPAYGVKPNTEWLPAELKSENDYVATNGKTLRVDAAGPRVYSAGDVSGTNAGGVLKIHGSTPILGANLSHDLLSEAGLTAVPEKTYVRKDDETQLVPIGAKTGVGAFNGWGMPGFAVAFAKGRDYFLGEMPGITEGKQYTKA